MERSVNVGTVVFSRAGRDKGRFYVVTEIVDDVYVKIADGKVRKLAKAKRKKVKHLKVTEDNLTAIAEKLNTGMKVYDAEIFSALKRYNF